MARNINQALSTINYSQKKEILDKLIERNKQMKKMDNLSVLTGSVDKVTKDFSKYDKDIPVV
jgi:precorrin-6B methylase 2